MIRFDDDGLVVAVVQDESSKAVLMVGYMNRESLARTLEGPHVWFYSRSRNELWEKGATSGNYLNVVDVKADCDGDALLVTASAEGPTCHTGATSCFQHNIEAVEGASATDSTLQSPAKQAAQTDAPDGASILAELVEVIRERAAKLPDGSYTAKLLREGTSRVAQKVIEEAGEVGLAAAAGTKDEVVSETADLMYSCLVLLQSTGVDIEDVWAELSKRRG